MKFIETLRRQYYQWIPYNYRPHELWYRFKCFVWHRYTTTKPKCLGHTWCDKVELLPHTMFQILVDFVEKECTPERVNWYHEYGHKVTVDGVEKFVRDEIQEIYDWYTKVYVPNFNGENTEYNKIWDKINENSPLEFLKEITDPEDRHYGNYVYDPEFDEPHKAALYKEAFQELNAYDQALSDKCDEMMHRLVNVRHSLWT